MSADDRRVAIVMPVHELKFEYALHFARSLLLCNHARDFAWYPVFSSHKELRGFSDLAAERSATWLGAHVWQPLIAAPNLRNPVASKRWHGLKHAFEQRGHDLALGVDAETEFASPASFAPQFDAWLEARVVLAARLNATERCPTRLRIAHDSCGVTAKQANAIDVAASQGGDISAYYYWWLVLTDIEPNPRPGPTV